MLDTPVLVACSNFLVATVLVSFESYYFFAVVTLLLLNNHILGLLDARRSMGNALSIALSNYGRLRLMLLINTLIHMLYGIDCSTLRCVHLMGLGLGIV